MHNHIQYYALPLIIENCSSTYAIFHALHIVTPHRSTIGTKYFTKEHGASLYLTLKTINMQIVNLRRGSAISHTFGMTEVFLQYRAA